MGFRKAAKHAKHLVISWQGPSGAGKTFSALNVAKFLCPPGKRIAFIDTENSADLYGDLFDFDVDSNFGQFGKLNYVPDEWMKKLREAAASGEYGVVILDSLTHMWKGQGGILYQLDQEALAYKAKFNKFADSNALWKKYDPIYARFMNDLRHLPFHVFFCLRAKQKYDRKQNEKGKTEITKVGLEPEFRDGFEFDVDAQFVIDEEHIATAKKHRLGEFLNGKVFADPGQNLAEALSAWLASGAASIENEPIPDTVPAPQSEPEPGSSTTNDAPSADAAASVFESLMAAIDRAVTAEDLAEVQKRCAAAKKEKLFTDSEYKQLADAFTAKMKAAQTTASAAE